MLSSSEATPEAIEITGLTHRVSHGGNGAGKRLFLLVHGRTGNAAVMWPFSRIFEKHDIFAVAPQAFLDDELGGFSWWQVPLLTPNESARPPISFEDLSVAADRLESFIARVATYYRTRPDRVYAMGFSQGAALIGALSLRRPELFSAVILLAGFIPRTAFEDGWLNPRVASGGTLLPKYFIAHGTRDETVPLEKAELARDSLCKLGAKVEFSSEEVGHKVASTSLKLAGVWFDEVHAESAGLSSCN